jgi:para-nitrobenzyl esterase
MFRQVTVENGTVRGLPAADPRITAFKGIPFAAPPVGDLRWKAPQPAASWDGVLEAFEFAPISMQAKPGLNPNDIYSREWNVDPEIAMSEDCLYLNVWTPAKSSGEKLPVFVWYFGGGLQVGNTAEMEFDGERIARRGVVVVTVNYRVNVFGFLVHPELTAEDPAKPTNFGSLDQQAGTRWVKRNIAAFGGDPENITIGGQSAGGASVMTQITSPENKGLFQRAIIDSGIMIGAYRSLFARRTFAESEALGVEFFRFLGVSNLAEARKLDATTIRDKAIEYKGMWMSVPDGHFSTGMFTELMLANQRAIVPTLLGQTATEFLATLEADSIESFERKARELFGDRADEFLKLCGAESGDLASMIARSTFSPVECGCRALCQRNEEVGTPVNYFYYIFNPEIPGWDNPGPFHSVDLWFWFETLAKCWRPFQGKHYDLARQMCNYWVNFMKTGDPNGQDADGTPLPAWAPYSQAKPYGMYFGDDCHMTAEGPNEITRFMVRQQLDQTPIRG